MAAGKTSLEEVLALAQRLAPRDQARLIARLAPKIDRWLDQSEAGQPSSPRTPLRGLLADLGPAPSEAEITDTQREMWATFSQETP